MCWMCEELGTFATCQFCGKLICFDYDWGDDVIGAAMVTEHGDLVCDDCYPDEGEDYEWEGEETPARFV